MDIRALTPNQVDAAAIYVGQNVGTAQSQLMDAFATREGAPGDITALANKLNAWGERQAVNEKGVPKWTNGTQVVSAETQPDGFKPVMERVTPDLKGLQMIAEQRFQHSTQVFSMFSALLDKIDQMKQRLIQKFGQG